MADVPGHRAENASEWGFVRDGPPKETDGTSLSPEPSDSDRGFGMDDQDMFGHREPGDDEESPEEDEKWDHDHLEGNYFYGRDLDHNNQGPPTKPLYITSLPYIITTYRKIEASRPVVGFCTGGSGLRISTSGLHPLEVERVIQYEGLPSKSEGPITCHLGKLSYVPQEVLEMILDKCTIESLLQLRAVNRKAEVTVHSLPVWKLLSYRLPYLLTTLRSRRLQLARHITAGDLLRKVVQVPCDQCGLPGDYLNLLSLERFCRFCEKNHRFQFFSVKMARKAWGLPLSEETALGKLPFVNNYFDQDPVFGGDLPETDPTAENQEDWAISRLIAGKHAHEVALQYYGQDAIEKIKDAWRTWTAQDLPNNTRPFNIYGVRKSLLPPDWMQPRPKTLIDKLRPRVPWLLGNFRDPVTLGVLKLDWGFRCFACEKFLRALYPTRWGNDKWGIENQMADHKYAPSQPNLPWHYRLYTDEAFEAHIKQRGDWLAINTAGYHKLHRYFQEEEPEREGRRGTWRERLRLRLIQIDKEKCRQELTERFYDPKTWHLDYGCKVR